MKLSNFPPTILDRIKNIEKRANKILSIEQKKRLAEYFKKSEMNLKRIGSIGRLYAKIARVQKRDRQVDYILATSQFLDDFEYAMHMIFHVMKEFNPLVIVTARLLGTCRAPMININDYPYKDEVPEFDEFYLITRDKFDHESLTSHEMVVDNQ